MRVLHDTTLYETGRSHMRSRYPRKVRPARIIVPRIVAERVADGGGVRECGRARFVLLVGVRRDKVRADGEEYSV